MSRSGARAAGPPSSTSRYLARRRTGPAAPHTAAAVAGRGAGCHPPGQRRTKPRVSITGPAPGLRDQPAMRRMRAEWCVAAPGIASAQLMTASAPPTIRGSGAMAMAGSFRDNRWPAGSGACIRSAPASCRSTGPRFRAHRRCRCKKHLCPAPVHPAQWVWSGRREWRACLAVDGAKSGSSMTGPP